MDYRQLDNHEDVDNRVEARNGEVVKQIKQYLNESENTIGRENKQLVVIKLLDFLLKHRDFVFNNIRFKETVKNKIIQFAVQENWRLEYYYINLFNEELPPNEILAVDFFEKIVE